jgi:hypothetical protein
MLAVAMKEEKVLGKAVLVPSVLVVYEGVNRK